MFAVIASLLPLALVSTKGSSQMWCGKAVGPLAHISGLLFKPIALWQSAWAQLIAPPALQLPSRGSCSAQVTLPGPPGTGLHCCQPQLTSASPAPRSLLPTPGSSNQRCVRAARGAW